MFPFLSLTFSFYFSSLQCVYLYVFVFIFYVRHVMIKCCLQYVNSSTEGGRLVRLCTFDFAPLNVYLPSVHSLDMGKDLNWFVCAGISLYVYMDRYVIYIIFLYL